MSIDKKKRNKTDRRVLMIGGIIAAAIILIGGGVAIAKVSNKKAEKENKATVSLNETQLTDKNNDTYISTDKTTVEIMLEDCAVPVGSVIQVTAIVTPDDTQTGLVWTSDHPDVFEVNKDGVVTVKSVGTAVLTATVGNVSDAVVIEGIASISDGSKNNLPVYTGSKNANGSYVSANGTGSASGTSNGSGSGSSYSDNGSDEGGSSDGGSGVDSDGGSGSPDAGDSGDGGSGDGGAGGNGDGGPSDGKTSGQIGPMLPDMGFTNSISNVYVYEEGDEYCGEIITQPNVTIIYIKNRTGGFDAKILSVLGTLVPSNSSQIWNNYLSASTDRTFTVDGRRVRIVVGVNGGHSQIVIYN